MTKSLFRLLLGALLSNHCVLCCVVQYVYVNLCTSFHDVYTAIQLTRSNFLFAWCQSKQCGGLLARLIIDTLSYVVLNICAPHLSYYLKNSLLPDRQRTREREGGGEEGESE